MTGVQSVVDAQGGRQRPGRFATYHHWDRNFFLLFLAVCWVGVVMGFYPAAIARFHGQANFPAPFILQVHAFAFIGWLFLLTIQILLVRAMRQRQHMMLGLTALFLLPVMLISGYVSELITQRFHFDKSSPNLAFFIVPIFYLVGLAVFATLALVRRKQPAAHKRLILLATTVIVGAGYGRWWGEMLFEAVGDGFWGMIVNTFAGLNLLLLGAVVYDWVTRRQIHSVYRMGVPAILVGELATSYVYHAPGWLPVAQGLIGR